MSDPDGLGYDDWLPLKIGVCIIGALLCAYMVIVASGRGGELAEGIGYPEVIINPAEVPIVTPELFDNPSPDAYATEPPTFEWTYCWDVPAGLECAAGQHLVVRNAERIAAIERRVAEPDTGERDGD